MMNTKHIHMPFVLISKVAAIWLLIALLAIANGILREKLMAPLFGVNAAVPLSGITLALIVFAVTYLTFPVIGIQNAAAYLLIGAQWLLMTLFFEFILGHYVIGQSWNELFQVFNLLKGNLFIFVLISSLFSPYIVARLKGVVK